MLRHGVRRYVQLWQEIDLMAYDTDRSNMRTSSQRWLTVSWIERIGGMQNDISMIRKSATLIAILSMEV
jgi:hypothetical protein